MQNISDKSQLSLKRILANPLFQITIKYQNPSPHCYLYYDVHIDF